MCNHNESESTSGFVTPSDIAKSDGFTDFTAISGRGVFQLTRAKRNGRWWMLKGLREEYRHDSIYRAFLEKEYEIASQLQHPMVVSVYSLEDVKDRGLCIVMEWIEGTTLKEWLAAGKHTLKQRRHIADMLLEVLNYVHSRQTQHRDLKPSNIMVTHDGQYLKLIDFGLSDTDSHAVLKAPAGTEGYMAPEGPSDIYSLGVILRELRLGWSSSWVTKKCCAPLRGRYHDISAIQRDLQRAWHWPRRTLYFGLIAMLVAVPYLFNLSHTQQSLQSVSDSLKKVREESNTLLHSQIARGDSFEQQMNQFRLERPLEQEEHPLSEQEEHPLSEQVGIQPSKQLTDSQVALLQKYEAEQAAILQHERRISEEKRQIDNRIKLMGIEQMLDTLSNQRYLPMPILTIVLEMGEEIDDPVLKAELQGYIEERYWRKWMKRLNELPYDD